jgi:hypothetical protein
MRHRFQLAGAALCAAATAGITAAACHSRPVYPLYDAARPPARPARLVGPVAKVDDRDVTGLGDRFDLDPGCHVLTLRQDVMPHGAPSATFGMMMSAGSAYAVVREPATVEMTETDPNGAVTRWKPMNPDAAGAKCQAIRDAVNKE